MNLLGLGILLSVGLAAFVILLVLFTARLLTRPPRRGYAWAVSRGVAGDPSELVIDHPGSGSLQSHGLAFEAFTFAGAQGLHLSAWSLRGLDPEGLTFVVSHGWGDSKVVMLSRIAVLAPLASRIIAWDMPGHGESAGACALGTREADDLIALLVAINEVVESNRGVVLYGYSLGAGVSVVAASRVASAQVRQTSSGTQPTTPIVGVVAEAPYRLARTPARNVLEQRGLPWRMNLTSALNLIGLRAGVGWGLGGSSLAGTAFDRAAEHHAGALTAPLLVLHGTLDAICPIADARQIAAAVPRAAGCLAEINGGGHSDLFTKERFRAACQDAIVKFVQQLTASAEIDR